MHKGATFCEDAMFYGVKNELRINLKYLGMTDVPVIVNQKKCTRPKSCLHTTGMQAMTRRLTK